MAKHLIQGCLACLGLIGLIFDSKTAINSAVDAIYLCIESIIPSIFPFMVLTVFLNSMIIGTSHKLLQHLADFLGIPRGSECIFVSALLGGYPTGARNVFHAWERNELTYQEASKMLAFCNNAGPAFIFGILSSAFSQRWKLWMLWTVHIVSAVFVARVFRNRNCMSRKIRQSNPISFVTSIKQSTNTMGYICGWIIIFRIIIGFMNKILVPYIPIELRIVLEGILELASGCCQLKFIDNEGFRFIICSGLLAFGGICVSAQTASVIGKLDMKQYWKGKCLQLLFSIVISMCVQYLFFTSSARLHIHPMIMLFGILFAVIMSLIARKIKNNSSIPEIIGV